MEYHRLDLVEQGIESFQGLDERAQECFLLINLQRNRLTNFEHFGTHPYLSELHLQHNQIQSFRGLTKQASLRVLCLQGCPIAAHPYYRLMALLTVGLGIEAIDGLSITSQERRIAKSLGKRAALAVSYGWLLDLRPRTFDDYEGLINDYKRLRKDERRQMQGRRCISVNSVLAELSREQQSKGNDGSAKRQLEEQQRTITRLARRVAQLEGQVAASAEGHVIPMLPPNQLEAMPADGRLSTPGEGFSATEVTQVDTVCFTRGIQLRHNFSMQSDLQRVCLQLDHTTLTVQAFFSRETLVQMPLRALRVRHLLPLTLLVEDEVGGALGLVFGTLPLLHTVYKTLFVLSARPIPLLSAVTQLQLQDMVRAAEKVPKAAPTAVTFSATSSVGRSASRASTYVEEMLGSDVPELVAGRAPVAATATVASEGSSLLERPKQNAASSAASVQLDNVEDVPPLPTAFSRIGTDSIVFSADKSHSGVAEDAARVSTMFKSSSNIDFQSVGPSNKESFETNAAATRPAEAPQSAEKVNPASSQRSKLFANLIVNSSTSSDSVVFHSDGAKTDGEDSVVMEEEKAQRVPPLTTTVSSTAVTSPPSVPLASRSNLAAPPRPPPRRSQLNMPVASVPVSATQRSVAGPPAVPPPLLRGSLSARSMEKSSLNTSMLRGSGSLLGGAGGSSIAFQVLESEGTAAAEGEKGEGKKQVGDLKNSTTNAPPAAPAAAPRPRVPSRFGALQVDSDSD